MKKKYLNSKEAISLWLSGVEVWNSWVNDNPNAEISFSNVDFDKYLQEGDRDIISFSGFVFPDGGTDFRNSRFTKSGADFSGAIFGNNGVDFSCANFDNGDVNFKNSKFHKGNVIFEYVNFGKGKVIFRETIFNEGIVDFSSITCSGTLVDFSHANFGDGSALFSGANFGEAMVIFHSTIFGTGGLSVDRATFDGHFLFSPHPEGLLGLKIINFNGITVKGRFFLGCFKTKTVIDLRGSYIIRKVDFDNPEINFMKNSNLFWIFGLKYKKSDDIKAASCYRRLRSLTKEAGEYQQSLDYFAKEMQSSYGISLKGLKLILFLIYDKSSSYGRSLVKPALLLIISVIMYALVYQHYSDNANFWEAITFSFSTALPFYSGSRSAKQDMIKTIFPDGVISIPDIVHFITISQGIISSVLLFLILLAFRNNFRN